MDNYLITGANGQLAYDIIRELKNRAEYNIYGFDSKMLDVTNRNQVFEIITKFKPSVIFHCAAYTKVDQAEDESKSCFKVNVEGTKNIVEAAEKVGSKVIYISTDYVFDGDKQDLYEIDDLPNPRNIYGLSKYCGEKETLKYEKSFVVRISWVFGINGNNFVKTMLRLAEIKNELNIVADQIGSPTYTVDVAKFLVDLSYSEKYGIYHATNSGFTTWYDFAKAIFELNNIKIKLNPVSTSEYKTKADRPINSKLSKNSLILNGFNLLPEWNDALKRFNEEIRENEARTRK